MYSPVDTGSSPERSLIRVDFPAPLMPTSATRSPRSITKRCAREHVFLPIALRNVAELGNDAAAGLRLRETEVDGLFVRRNFDALDLLQFLDAALHLFGFGRLIAEAVDERFQLFDAVALVGVSGFQLRAPLGFSAARTSNSRRYRTRPACSRFRRCFETVTSRKNRSCEISTNALG